MMEQLLQQWITDILQAHPGVMDIALQQRAKFEGWLKFELAASVMQHGGIDLCIEAAYAAGRADLSYQYGGETFFLEMKTVNTNWRMAGVQNKHRPITKNIQSLVIDAEKLTVCHGRGILVFVLFPILRADDRWKVYLQRIAADAHLTVDVHIHCSQVSLPLSNGPGCDVVVGCIGVPRVETSLL
ncbi:MAG: hypothetical protein ACYDBB_02410 [Armatimonadota bacterium]